MKRGTTLLTTLPLVLALTAPCWAQVRELPTQTTHHCWNHRDDRSEQARHEHQDGGRRVRCRQRARERQRALASSRWAITG